MSNKKFNEDELAAYANSVESVENTPSITMPEEDAPQITEVSNSKTEAKQPEANKRDLMTIRNNDPELQKTTIELHAEREDEIRRQSVERGIGKVIVPVEGLPSKGLFYPEGTKIWISAATLGDIRRWSAMNEDDIQDVTEKMQNILESCCTINFGAGDTRRARWKDLLDVDRLYLLFAIHDYTFPPGKNDVRIKINEKDDIIMRKENVKFIEFPEKLMKFYNEQKRCFSFPVENKNAFSATNGMMDIYIPTIGTSDWLQDYLISANQRNDNVDRDFISYASLLISDWRLLSIEYYYDLIERSTDWGTYEWTLISKVRDNIINAAGNPTIIYVDKGGVEREVPLYFRDGFKSLFQVALKIDL